jgi:hypothetical protein
MKPRGAAFAALRVEPTDHLDLTQARRTSTRSELLVIVPTPARFTAKADGLLICTATRRARHMECNHDDCAANYSRGVQFFSSRVCPDCLCLSQSPGGIRCGNAVRLARFRTRYQ